eukprot:TRINITY_DN3478_c0_g1_i1.p1 TRINITY_DN3478_c0_g1~~TRINITY_DN3478_c0_g1_i1.p1  ORF type:complete len:503 (+),score=138.75 TRINITY_DN3478_c0_g1_i1:65-1573(+)
MCIRDSLTLPKMQLGITFDEILLVPQYSEISSRSDISLRSRLSRNVPLVTPIVSSPMDTVTEARLAIEMARNGGLGFLHRFCSIEEQAKMVAKVKRAESFVIQNPFIIDPEDTIANVRKLVETSHVKTFLVTNTQGATTIKGYGSPPGQNFKLLGIFTSRDQRSAQSPHTKVKDLMTPRDRMTVYETDAGVSLDSAYSLLLEKRLEKVPIVDSKNNITGLITIKDIIRVKDRPLANLNEEGKLYVGAAIGAKDDYLERAKALIDAGCDVLCVDIANGHSQTCVDAVIGLKEAFPNVDVVAGSVATGDGAERLIRAGADGIRCGIGNGSICITRLVAGAGVPQFTALLDVAPVCKKYNVPLISDGGNKNSGNMCKALAVGADSIMVGRLVAGTEEAPGNPLINDGKLVKIYRGMAGYGANLAKAQRIESGEPSSLSFVPEGVEGYIPYVGSLKDVLHQFHMGIRSGMSYCGARDLAELQKKARFIRISPSSIAESNVHGVRKI